MSTIPQEKVLDNSLRLLLEGFPFIQNRVERFQSNIFKTRIMFQNVICLHGEEAAKVFYDPDKFMRYQAIPNRIQRTLMGKDAIQTMDGEVHLHRKAMFMSLMNPDSLHKLNRLMTEQWQAYIKRWEQMDEVVLFEESQDLLCRVACAWTGVPLKEKEVRLRAQDFAAMVDAFGAVGPRHMRGRKARKRAEKWIGKIIKDIRKGKLGFTEGSPAHVVAFHRDLEDNLLDVHMAAVELINLLRPIVAIAWYITFGAVALQEHPVARRKIAEGEEGYVEMFVQEVRRYYPFGPFLGNRVKNDFDWGGHHFKKGTLVFLDIYGTLHDPNIWKHPDEFYPYRFRDWDGSPYNFIPQGGGDHFTGHRCAGEWVTIETMKVSMVFLSKYMDYDVPPQDLSFSLVRMPTYPNSKFIMRNVKGTHPQVEANLNSLSKCPFHHSA
ncbi:cytochrome P450 [Rufibacter latericius]|uniref:Cytochrome P450 n=1 Tax=Rufibacter latericius TaxID=2487040 RepID=A0A3M9MHR7_9BACT|nr:cytochrome P450 [Rufibacter latericius]RNI25044.1 cytochrome P450 [Rufibacter latericius]